MRKLSSLFLVAALAVMGGACDDDDQAANTGATTTSSSDGAGVSLTVYSGRGEELVGPLLARFEEGSAIDLDVRYGDTAELAAQILEEGGNSPADVFFAQDAGALGALEAAGAFTTLPDETLALVDEGFRSPTGAWVGTSGRARVAVYNTDALSESDLPPSILDFTDPKWEGKLGWAPTNGSFQAFVTALRLTAGEDAARDWLEGIKANGAQAYEGNSAVVQAVIDGEIEVGFVNHYYLLGFLASDPDVPAANYFFPGGDPGSLVNVAGAGIVDATDREDLALRFVDFLLSDEAQEYFAGAQEDDGFEYPVVEGVPAPEGLPALSEIEQPDIDLADLADLDGTLQLLEEVGLV